MKKIASQLGADDVVGGLAGRISWQSAFIQAMKMELRDCMRRVRSTLRQIPYQNSNRQVADYEGVLDFYDDHRLTEEPLRIDCVVIKKTENIQIKKNIATIFREHNLIEYKSPGDYVSVADFYKVYAYACLYASLEEVPITSLTLSFVERRYPRKLLSHLQTVRGYTVAENAEGIYSIKGDIIPMQIIDSRRLSADENLWLKSLSDKLNSLEVTRISEEIARLEKDTQIAAYLNVIREANTESLQEAIEMGRRKQSLTFDQVCENVGWTAKWEARGRAEGEAKGKAEGKLEIARKMKVIGRPESEITEITGLSPDEVAHC
jgi:hypothetical protein